MRVVTLAAAAALLLGFTSSAAAHPVPFSYVDVHLNGLTVEVTVVAHDYDLSHDLGLGVELPERLLSPNVLQAQAARIVALIDARLQVVLDGEILRGATWSRPDALPERQSVRVQALYNRTRTAGLVEIRTNMFPYDPLHQTFINVYENGELRSQAILDARRTSVEYFAGTRQGALAVIRRFVPSGVHHILIGPDHVLFLIGLLLLGGSIRRLVLIVTGFTVAHSITLSLAALNIVTPPPSLIEPAIALSIVYVGVDNLMVRGGRDVRAWIAFGFGFVHGFGFANVLREMDLPARALGWSLFSFNLGVEIGQLAVVLVVATALEALRRWSAVAGRRVAFAGSLLVIAAGAYWFVQRVFWGGGVA